MSAVRTPLIESKKSPSCWSKLCCCFFKKSATSNTGVVVSSSVNPFTAIISREAKIAHMYPMIECDAKYIPTEEFGLKIQRCIDLLRMKASSYYEWLIKYNLKIRAYSRSGANLSDNSIDIALATFNASDTWLSSIFIHEAVHFWQYKSGLYKVDEATKHEIEANQYQLRVLQLLEAPQHEIEYVQKADGKHWDLSGKGTYNSEDYRLRTY